MTEQRFEPEVNSWNDIHWSETQFVFVPKFSYYELWDISQNFLEMNVLILLIEKRKTLDKVSNTNTEKLILPTFHDSSNIVTDMGNAQRMHNPSDITFVTTKNEYILLRKDMLNKNISFKLRLSNDSIQTYIHGHDNMKFWTLARDSLLMEPVSMALFRIMVSNLWRNCEGCQNWPLLK